MSKTPAELRNAIDFTLADVRYVQVSGAVFLMPPMALTVMAAGRWIFRALVSAHWRRVGGSVRTLVYGAGYTGNKVARLVSRAEDRHYEIVGYIDDNRDKRFKRVEGHRVLGTGADLVNIAAEERVKTVILWRIGMLKAPAVGWKRRTPSRGPRADLGQWPPASPPRPGRGPASGRGRTSRALQHGPDPQRRARNNHLTLATAHGYLCQNVLP